MSGGYRNECVDTEMRRPGSSYIIAKGLFMGIQNDLNTDDFEGWEPN